MGDPARPPSRMATSLGDCLAALFAAYGTMVAIRHRYETGKGQVVDSALYEACFRITDWMTALYSLTGNIKQRPGSRSTNPPNNQYLTKDGKYVNIICNADRIVHRLYKAMGREDLIADERYATTKKRHENNELVNGTVAEWAKQYTMKELVEILERADVPVGPINNIQDIFETPHFWEREAITTVQHPKLGEVKVRGVVPKLSLTPGKVKWPGGDMGQHNEEVYCGILGLSKDKLAALKAEGVV